MFCPFDHAPGAGRRSLGSAVQGPLELEARATWTFLLFPFVANVYQVLSDSWKMAGSGKFVLITGLMVVAR
jgi:hypothetical protein